MSRTKGSVWRDVRFWRFAGQAIAVVVVILVLSYFLGNLTRNLRQLGIQFGFNFLRSQAGFGIGDRPIPYQPSDSYTQALLVGLVNSLRVIVTGIALATVVGVTAGIARLSDNWLVRNLSLVYVETLRNTPLLLQLFFWYFAVFFSLPPVDAAVRWFGVSLSKSGVQLPGGLQLSSEFSALLLGLSIYTGTFIAEVVRGAIQSVPQGQWEAGRSLGLKPAQLMRLVVFPQALRAMIPPLANQYLNLAKNSSLAIAIGYPDVYAVASTTFNQTGRAVEVMVLICATYLTISLVISLLLNLFNRSVQIVER
ncbi:ABC transporter permease subunit [Leptolyngbya sp. FACHB-36]|uniref:amino acid ABC transporter permease n=1 Tax=Leptolyngbya sp. FACHB-36 TaxID=2692808 RepID=UPI00168019D4|nr:ABC transporter permease subunit [Leptolyngbya sp. FACHB-36]MBD2020849.1 ABC transporter permease subunit [Leptolyngbya sp. FACHB-36]